MKTKFFYYSIVLLLFLFTGALALAQEGATDSAGLSASKIVDYELPYPGILPDSRFYFFKAFRDQLIGSLISDPLKKAEFNLLQADKRLNAGVYLFRKGEQELAESTISKGENYFEKAINKAEEAKKQGIEASSFWNVLLRASKKHKQVLEDLEDKSPQAMKNKLGELRKRVENFEKKVSR